MAVASSFIIGLLLAFTTAPAAHDQLQYVIAAKRDSPKNQPVVTLSCTQGR